MKFKDDFSEAGEYIWPSLKDFFNEFGNTTKMNYSIH